MSIPSNQLIVTTPRYNDPHDLLTIASEPAAKLTVAKIAKLYYGINVAQAMKDLSAVSGLIRTTDTSCIGQKCNVHIMKIYAHFRFLIRNHKKTSRRFGNSSLQTLRGHKTAIALGTN